MNDSRIETIYDFLAQYINDNNGRSPSLREIADGCYMNISTIHKYVDILQAQGRIERHPHQARSIRLPLKQ